MDSPASDKLFAGSIPILYESYLVPLIFEPYADDLAARLKDRPLSRVLEVAAGTGVVTRALASALPGTVEIIATDLNQAMLDEAERIGAGRPVTWQTADAMQLPFPDDSFDAVVCQFGVMFFPDKAKAYAEALRVLRPGGVFLFTVWGSLAENDFADAVNDALAALFPGNPPHFLSRTPYGYFDPRLIGQELAAGGFTATPRFETVTARSVAADAEIAALAFCQGTPLRNEIEARGGRLGETTMHVGEAIAERCGQGAVTGKIQALVVEVEK